MEVAFLMGNWLLSGFSFFVEGLRGSKGGVEGGVKGDYRNRRNGSFLYTSFK